MIHINLQQIRPGATVSIPAQGVATEKKALRRARLQAAIQRKRAGN